VDDQVPNVLFILADDLGSMDVNSFAERLSGTPAAQQFYETPNIDRLAQRGVSFTQAYSTHLCTPTRAALLTGKYAATLGFTSATVIRTKNYYNQNQTPPASYQLHDQIPRTPGQAENRNQLINGTTLMALPSGFRGEPDVTTFIEAMPGHHRAFTGKWHLGSYGATGHQPKDNGFDEILLRLDNTGSSYFNWKYKFQKATNRYTGENMSSIGPFNSGEAYLTDDMGARAEDYILRRHQTAPNDPWMLEVSFFAVHVPIIAKNADRRYFNAKSTKGWNGQKNADYAGMIKSMDDAVGRILDTLEATGELDNTVIVFMSDNGGVSSRKPGDNAPTTNTPLRGGKAQLYEGGVRVPLIVSAPFLNHPTNVTSDAIVDATDIAPTILDLAGYDSSAFVTQFDCDGESLRPLLADPMNANAEFSRDTVFYHFPYYVKITDPMTPPTSGIRMGDWKLIVDETGYVELFNIRDDLSEQLDLSSVHPQIAGRLYWVLRNWQENEVPERYRSKPNPNYEPIVESNWHPYRDLDQIYDEYRNASIAGD
jgi:arylsulfatase A-like enzyme